eukprot:sb/3474213/
MPPSSSGGGVSNKRRKTSHYQGNLPAALICIKTLQDFLATKAACLSAPDRLNYLLHRSMMHNLAFSMEKARTSPVITTPPGLLSPPSSTSSHLQHVSPPSSTLLSPPTTPGEMKVTSPAFICSVTNVRSLAGEVKVEKDL